MSIGTGVVEGYNNITYVGVCMKNQLDPAGRVWIGYSRAGNCKAIEQLYSYQCRRNDCL